MVVLILKGGGDYRGIGLVAVILNRPFTASITYHESLHGLRPVRNTGTATLEINLIHQVAALRESVLHAIFLDLHKSYDDLDRSRCLYILDGYGVGHRSLRLLCRYWEKLRMVEQAGEYYGETLRR